MSTITKEQAKDLRNAFECWQQDYDPVDDKEQYDMFGLGIVAMDSLLASLEAEAVGFIARHKETGKFGSYLHPKADWFKNDDYEVLSAYTAPPAPVSVPDEVTAEDCPAFIKYDLTEVDEAWARGFNACRAAMIHGAENAESPTTMQAAPALDSSPKIAESPSGNSPVIPDCWVACSERMPEIGIKVLCFPVNDEPIHATYNGQVWLQDISWSASDDPIDNVISCNVFHWMPLPAAPQREGENV